MGEYACLLWSLVASHSRWEIAEPLVLLDDGAQTKLPIEKISGAGPDHQERVGLDKNFEFCISHSCKSRPQAGASMSEASDMLAIDLTLSFLEAPAGQFSKERLEPLPRQIPAFVVQLRVGVKNDWHRRT